MRSLTYQESKEWCEQAPLSMKVGEYAQLSYRSPAVFGMSIRIPPEVGPALALCSGLLDFEANSDFYGGLLWLANWDIGTPQLERVGLKMVEQMRRGYGVCSSIENAPGNLFRTDEIADLQAFLCVPILFGWDAYFVPRGTRYFAYARNNGFLYLVTDEEHTHSRLLSHLAYWKPSSEVPSYVTGGGISGGG
jgi:hypothetical protein